MKRIIILFILFFPITAYTQEVFATYEMSYFNCGKTTYEMLAEIKNDKIDKIYIEGSSFDASTKKTVLIIEGAHISKFGDYLKAAKDKYIEWTKTAIDNNVKDLNKVIPLESQVKYMVGFIYGDWNFARNVNLQSRFRVSDGFHLLILDTGKLTSMTNEYIQNDGFVIVFNNIKEIDYLLNKISKENLDKVANDKVNKESLFN